MIKLKNILTEEVYGNKATVYHRTRSANLLTSLLMDGFKHSSGMYGEGIYTTYEPTKHTDWMPTDEDLYPEGRWNYDNYGMFEIKFSVDLINFFIFDWEVYQKVTNHVNKVEKFTKKKSDINNFINLQAEYFKLPTRMNTPYKKKYTSKLALKFGFTTKYTYSDSSLVNGIVFFGSQDGNVLVCYNKAMIILISMSHSNSTEPLNLQKILDSNMQLKDKFKEYFKAFIKSKDESMSNIKKSIFDIAKEKWNYDGRTNLFSFDGDVIITNEFVKDGKLLIQFDKVGGKFSLYNTDITTLVGSPKEVGKVFTCTGTDINSLEGGPSIVGERFYCDDTRITSLKGAPHTVGKSFSCSGCLALKSLEGAPHTIGEEFSCHMAISLKSLEHLPIAKKYYVPYNLEDELKRIRKERGEIK